MLWMYHSHIDETAETYAGLAGGIIVTGKGELRRVLHCAVCCVPSGRGGRAKATAPTAGVPPPKRVSRCLVCFWGLQ